METSFKSRARIAAKQRRIQVQAPGAGIELIRHFPAMRFRGAKIGGFWPLENEIDIRPLLCALESAGHIVGLPCIIGPDKPLLFRKWRQGNELRRGPFKTLEPFSSQPQISPSLILVPLLAFTADGKRLGYGGGYYDRTLERLKLDIDIFACGVAFAGQETGDLPIEAHDVPLDGILTQDYFKVFS